MQKNTVLNEIYGEKIPKTGKQKAEKFVNILKNILNTNLMKFTDGSNDQGIDAAYFTSQSESGIIFQIKSCDNFSDCKDKHEPEKELMAHDGKIMQFIKNAQKPLNSSGKKINELSTLISQKKIKNLTVYFITFRKIYDKSRKKSCSTRIEEINVFFEYFDNTTLDDLISKLWYNKDFHLNVKGQTGKLNCLKEKYIKHDDDSFTAEVKLIDLKEFVGKFIDKSKETNSIDFLTNSNARDFLGSNKNNKKIEKTITTENFKENHFYHMGIIIICESFDFDEEKLKLEIISPSFANGAQTIGTIMDVPDDKCKKDTKFIVRVVKAPNEDLIKKIVLFSNSQTNITEDMKYGFDEDQQRLFCLLAKYGFFYKNRFFSKSSQKIWEKKIKNIKKNLPSYKNPFEFLLKEGTKIKPSFLAQAMYVVENDDKYGEAYNSLNLFRYEPLELSNLDHSKRKINSVYKKTFFKIEDPTENSKTKKIKLKKIEEYLIPFLIVTEINKNKKLFKNKKTDFSEQKISLTPGDITKLKLYLTAQWVKKIKKKRNNVIEVALEFVQKGSFKEKIKKFMEDFQNDLETIPSSEQAKHFRKIGSVAKIIKKDMKKN